MSAIIEGRNYLSKIGAAFISKIATNYLSIIVFSDERRYEATNGSV